MEKAEEALAELISKTPRLAEALQIVPLKRALDDLSSYDSTLGYHQMKPRLKRLTRALETRFGENLAVKYGLAVLAELIRGHDQRWHVNPLDCELKPEFVDSFHRILSAVSRGGVLALKPDTDAYAKELAICLHRLIPAGGQMIDPGSGIPRRAFLGAPFGQAIAAAYCVFLKSKGRSPFAEFHTNIFMRQWFTPDGWEYSFQLMQSVFRTYPKLKGLMGASWFFDPKLQEISPELNFVRSIALRWGAVIVRLGPDGDPHSGALTMSKQRQELFERGSYVPEIYAMIVSKHDVLAHASRI